MRTLYNHINTYKLLYCGLVIYALFYISALQTHWLDIFFSAAALHVGAKGIDFLQVPRGAWSAWHGSSLSGAPLANKAVYAPNNWVNANVYHPFFTIALGSFLMQFDPTTSYAIWIWMKLAISLAGVAYFYWSFRDQKYVQLATFVLLAGIDAYLEIAAGQYHLLFNVFLLLFVVSLIKRQHWMLCGFLFLLCLLVKPVGLLFVPILIIKKRWKAALFGLALFTLLTWLFSGDPYYINNLQNNIFHPWHQTEPQIITLNVLLYYDIHWSDLAYRLIQDSALALIMFISAFRRIHITKAFFLMIACFLLFYNLIYEYDWSTLAYVIAPCVIMCPSFQTRFSRIAILLTCLPSCFIILNLLHIDVINGMPGMVAWQPMVISKLVPLFLLCGSVLWPDIKPIMKHAKAFFFAIRKVNEHLGTFGEEPEEELEPTIVL